MRNFNPRTPCGVRLVGRKITVCVSVISIHAPHAGCDQNGQCRIHPRVRFQSTHPMRGATHCAYVLDVLYTQFQSTHPMRGATGYTADQFPQVAFQSTHPMRGATRGFKVPLGIAVDFNPRTPCGVRLEILAAVLILTGISIHAPHAGCDGGPEGGRRKESQFQSTHPMRGATTYLSSLWARNSHFNPRTPCGVRQPETPMIGHCGTISIHAPHAGCDPTSPAATSSAQ